MNNNMLLTVLLNKKKKDLRFFCKTKNLNKKKMFTGCRKSGDSSNHKALVNILPIQPSSQSAIHFFSTYPSSGCVAAG